MNLIGKKFGYLTVIELNNKHARGNSWICKCDCGNEVVLSESHLVGTKNRRPNKSCGCESEKQNGDSLKHKKIYGIYASMLYRCSDHKSTNYEWYGAKGIDVCDEWKDSFQAFYKWAYSNGYKEGLWIERIDSRGDYTPENCTWVSATVQAITKGNNKNNKSGIRGVCKSRDRYRAYITIDYKTIGLGSFDNLEDAAKARKDAEVKYYKPLIDEYMK